MTRQIHQTNCQFSRETLLLINEYEKELEFEQVNISRENVGNRIGWVLKLISDYDETEAEYNEEVRIANSHKDYNVVCKALNKGKLPNEIKRTIMPTNYKDTKRCNVKKIVRTIHLLKIAQKMGKRAFEKFVLIPDVNYVLNVIEKDKFGDLMYLNQIAA